MTHLFTRAEIERDTAELTVEAALIEDIQLTPPGFAQNMLDRAYRKEQGLGVPPYDENFEVLTQGKS